MKRTTLYAGAAISLMGVVATGVFISNSKSPLIFATRASSTVTYKHYNAIAPTDNGHGCCEFWVSCSDFSYSLTRPTEGNIVEGGNITDNPSFDWNGMDFLDERFVPSINQQKAWGMHPVLDLANNKITYGLYPQTYVSDSATISALDDLPESAIWETTGYYYYNGNFYQNCLGDKCDNDNHFADGTKVVDGTKYWFLCEPVSWVIMKNSGSTYQLYSEKMIHAGLTWAYSNSNIYENCQVRDWLNGTGSHLNNGFFQTGLFGSNEYVQSMTFTPDDGSSTMTDNVRLLTTDEANDANYFANNNARMIIITDWTAAHHACFKNGSSSYGRWWLCEANTDTTTNVWGVGLSGDVGNGGPKTGNGSKDRGERPVITISL